MHLRQHSLAALAAALAPLLALMPPRLPPPSPNPPLQSELSNDPDLLNNALWGMTGTYGINAPAAWDAQTDCSSVVVGVIDTGIDVSHPDLAANIWRNPGEVADGVDNDANGAALGSPAAGRPRGWQHSCLGGCWTWRG